MDRPSVRLRLRVSPGSRHSGIVGRHGDAWKVRVAARPERGRANAAILELLATTLRVSSSDIEVVAGATGRDKVVLLHGLTEHDVEATLAGAAETSR
ncbi:MAG TPA: DUF167 domain-containing protein [Gaiellaceae bacterium]|nr:DUF167 domain-containing protein [Gaiellaceae bacterium]